MKERLLNYIVCPECKGQLVLKNTRYTNGEIIEGSLACENCKAEYPIRDYIPRFVKTDSYVNNFSLQWSKYRETQLDSVSGLNISEKIFYERTNLSIDELKGKVVLDAGCGIGRYTEITRRNADYVIAIDLSYSVDNAFYNVGYYANVDIVQADIMKLPFKDSTFDVIFSLGVLHHTENTKRAFDSLCHFLKKNGILAIWVYSNEGLIQKIYNFRSYIYRAISTRLSETLLYKLCRYVDAFYSLTKIPVLWFIFMAVIPLSRMPDKEWRILDTFDWYSPKYQHKHSYREVTKWFQDQRMIDIKKMPYPIAIRGKRCF
jgi:SAM-dependent methyltransferase